MGRHPGIAEIALEREAHTYWCPGCAQTLLGYQDPVTKLCNWCAGIYPCLNCRAGVPLRLPLRGKVYLPYARDLICSTCRPRVRIPSERLKIYVPF